MMPVKLLTAIVGLVALAVSGAAAQTLSLKESVPHITTVGRASADVVPDEAVISLGVASERPTAAAASSEMAKAAAAVVAEIRARGIDAKDVKTTSVNLATTYDNEYDQRGQLIKHVLRGYEASEALSIHIHDVSKVGSITQSLIEKGANQFSGITFDYSGEKEKRRELQAEAMRDALAEARSFTSGIGLTLGRVIQIGNDAGQGGDLADVPMRRPVPGKTVSSVAVPVEPGVETIEASISVTWEIENAPR